MPEQVLLYSEKSTATVRAVQVKDIFDQGTFKNGNTIELPVKDLPRGNYYLHVVPRKDSEQKTDKIRILLESPQFLRTIKESQERPGFLCCKLVI